MTRKYDTFPDVDDRDKKRRQGEVVKGSRSVPKNSPNIGWPMSGERKDEDGDSLNESASSVLSNFYSLIYAEEKRGGRV